MIAGTHKLHCIRSVTSEVVEVKEFSNSKEFRLERVLPPTVQDKPLHQSRVMAMTDIKGYITDKYDRQWWIGGWDVFLKHFQKPMKWKSVFYINMDLQSLFVIQSS